MIPMKRPSEPSRLAERAAAWTASYVARKSADDAHSFRWPELTHNGERIPLNQYLLPLLLGATASHCAYCDGYPFGEMSIPTIDHFRPKGLAAFRHLAFAWENLFPACNVCQQEKGDTFDEGLLKPDEATYAFERYFDFNRATGELMPNAEITPEEQARASLTIQIFELNLPPRRTSRLRMFERWYRDAVNLSPPDLDALPYRYLVHFSDCGWGRGDAGSGDYSTERHQTLPDDMEEVTAAIFAKQRP